MTPRPLKPKGLPASPRYKKRKVAASNSWDRHPIPPTGDPNESDIHTAVGRALSNWEILETEMAGLFDRLIGVGLDSHASHRAYGAVTISSVKRDMLNAASEAYFAEFHNPSLQLRVNRAIDTADKLSARRNDIAHGIVEMHSQHYDLSPDEVDSWLLFPAFTSTKHVRLTEATGMRRFAAKYAYTAQMIRNYGVEFAFLATEVAYLIEEVGKRDTEPKEGS